MSSYLLYGAGAVGGVIGGRLHLAGHDVTLVARGEHLARIRADGLLLDTAEGREVVRAPATDTAVDVDWAAEPIVVLTVKSHQTDAALADLVRHAPAGTAVVCAQNGVANEPAALRVFASTYAITVMLPAQHLEPGLVVQSCHPVPGILDVGRFPSGTDDLTDRVAADLRSAGFESVPRPDIMAWKYRKLVTNAVGDVRAVLPDEADGLGALVRAEAEAVLAAAGVPMVSHQADLARRGDLLQSPAEVEGPNSLGQSLARDRHRGRLPGRRDRAAGAAARRTDPGQREGAGGRPRALVPNLVYFRSKTLASETDCRYVLASRSNGAPSRHWRST